MPVVSSRRVNVSFAPNRRRALKEYRWRLGDPIDRTKDGPARAFGPNVLKPRVISLDSRRNGRSLHFDETICNFPVICNYDAAIFGFPMDVFSGNLL